ncbi:MAG: TonB-dependent receptor [bacterium]
MSRRRAALAALLVIVAGVASARTGSVSGFVREAASGEPLPYANVYLEGTTLGTASGDRGYYFIGGVPEGEHELVASYVGYAVTRRRVTVGPGAAVKVDLELGRGAVSVDEVVVSAERSRFEREVEVSATRLETRQLQLMPKVGGELDLLRTVQLLPGVITTSDFSNRLYIRGGSPDQNLILLDGITVYNPSHLFGLFSPFIPEAVADVTLLAGGFPAEYGGRISSVLDVTTREGNSKAYAGEGSVSFIAAKAIAEGPLPGGSFLAAARRTYLPDVLLGAFGVEGVGYHFYDLIGKGNYALNPDVRLTVSALLAEDVLNFSDPANPDDLSARLAWGNRGVSLRSNLILNPTLYGELLGAWSNLYSVFDVRLGGDTAKLTTDLTDGILKADFTWYLADRHTLDFGAESQYLRMNNRADFDTFRFRLANDVWPLDVYASDRWEVVPAKLFVKPGLRYAWYSSGNKHELEPRFGVKYLPAENTALSASFGRFSQPLVTLNSTDAVFSVYDVWQVVPAHRRSPSALHYIAGVEHWLAPELTVKLEGYYKDYADLLETRYGAFFTPADSLLPADGYSCGADLLLRRAAPASPAGTLSRVNGWVSYSWMWTRRNIGAEAYFPHYDRRHNLNLVLSLPALFWQTDVSARFTIGTGLPYSGAVGFFHRYQYDPAGPEWPGEPGWELINGPRDAFRYPLYHRLDVGLTRAWRLRRAELSVFLDVVNAYYAKNVLLYYWGIREDELPVRRQIDMLPILPTVGVKVRF